MSSRVVEIRYSLNGLAESQLQNLFDKLDQEKEQIIFKRITDSRYSLSLDDIILQGNFSNDFITSLSQILPLPLMIKVENERISRETFNVFGSKKWESESTTIYVGNTLLPLANLNKVIGYTQGEQFIKLLTTSPAGSYLKPLLLTKAKGMIEADKYVTKIVFPMHRIDFLLEWIDQVLNGVMSFDWLTGATGELSPHLAGCNGELDPDLEKRIITWVNNMDTLSQIDLEKSFRRSLKVIY